MLDSRRHGSTGSIQGKVLLVTQMSLEKLSLVKVQLPVTQMSLEMLSLGKV
jgi:hypothetical protein